jgi:predicted nucleotide-binding protein
MQYIETIACSTYANRQGVTMASWYHVRVSLKSQPGYDEVRLDLTMAEIEERFLRPYREGRPMVVGGRTIPVDDLAKIRVNVTEQRTDAILPIVQAEQRTRKIGTTLPNDWHLAAYGREITDELITSPPASEMPTAPALSGAGPASNVEADPRSVFVVHGRNSSARDAMFTFLRSLHLAPMEWNEAIQATGKPNPFVGDVLTVAFSRAQTVLVLMTPDDEARLRSEFQDAGDPPHEVHLTPQARPNVLFEAGMAMARDETRTVLVELGHCRPFSDIGGRHVLHLNNTSQRRQELAERLKMAGADVRTTGTDWHTAGDFSIRI